MDTPGDADRQCSVSSELSGSLADVDSPDHTAVRTRWAPDEQLVPAILASGKRVDGMKQLDGPDRCWVVAGLTVAGLTAEDIADRLDCSLRLVRSIRAEDMTQVCVIMARESRNFADELRLARADAKAKTQELDETNAELVRTKGQLSRLIDAQIVGARLCGKCGTPMVGYNVYVHKKTGKEYCRECHRRRQQNYRDERKIGPAQIDGGGLAGKLTLTVAVNAGAGGRGAVGVLRPAPDHATDG